MPGDVQLLVQLDDTLLGAGAHLGLALRPDFPSRFARGGVGGILRRFELAHDLRDRAPGDLAVELLHLAVDHLDRRLAPRCQTDAKKRRAATTTVAHLGEH